MKKQSATNNIKKIEIKAPPTIKATLEGQMDKHNITILKKQIDLKPLTHAFENFFCVILRI